MNLDALAFDAATDDVDAFKRDGEEQLAGRVNDLALHALFTEELGAVLQIRAADRDKRHGCAARPPAWASIRTSSASSTHATRSASRATTAPLFHAKRDHLQRIWSETTCRMQTLRDNPDCAREEYDRIIEPNDPGLNVTLTFEANEHCRRCQAPALASPSCASRASTARSRWPRRSTAPASSRSTCT